MSDDASTVRVAVVQAAPVLFDREATVEKTRRLTAEAAARGARLILFPEAFIPAYPRGLGFGSVVGSRSPEGRRTWQTYWANAVDVPGPATEALGEAARRGARLSGDRRHRAGQLLQPGHALLHPALLRPRRAAAGQASQTQADGGGAAHLGRGRRQHADGPRDGIRQGRAV